MHAFLLAILDKIFRGYNHCKMWKNGGLGMGYNKGTSGNVIKVIAIILMIVGLIGSAVTGSQLAENLSGGRGGFLYFLVLGLVSALPSLMLYGFGELIQNTSETHELLTQQLNEINQRLQNMEQEHEKDTNQPKANASTSTAAVPVKPNPVKEPAPFVDKEQDFFESLLESDSIGEMIEHLSKEYSAQGNPDIDQLIADLQKLAFQERLYGKMTDAAKKKIQKFAEQVGK